MKRKLSYRLEDILGSISKIEEYTENISEQEFYENMEKQDSIVRRLEIIGEAAQ